MGVMLGLVLAGCAEVGQSARARPEAEPEIPAAWEERVPNARRPAAGILSGGQPTVEQLQALRDGGLRTVINLRAEGEPGAGAEEVEALGMRYVSIPIRGAESLSEEKARAFAAALAEAERPTLVHCASGNRVGALFALKAYYVDGASADEALAIGDRAGLTRLSEAVRGHLEEASSDGSPSTPDSG